MVGIFVNTDKDMKLLDTKRYDKNFFHSMNFYG